MHRLHRTPRLPLVAVALLSLLAPLALTSPGAQARSAAPEFRVLITPAPGNPLSVDGLDPADPPPSPDACIAAAGDPYDRSCYEVNGAVYVSETTDDVVATVVEHDGLYVDPLVSDLGTLRSNGPAGILRYAVRARTEGMHTLTIEVTAPGAEPRRVSLPYVWRAGGPPIEGDDSLRGRLYGRNVLGSFPCGANGRCTYRTSERVTFRDATRVGTALALDGKNTCGPAGCSPYRYDTSSGLLQVGEDTIGRITSQAAFVDGDRYARMVYPRPGQRLDGWWSYGAEVDEGRGVQYQDLRLRKNGHFRLDYFVSTRRYHSYGEPETGSAYGRHLSGTYVIERRGRLVLHDPKRGRKVATLALIATPSGKALPRTKGIWLDLSINPPKGRSFVDGNRMNFLR